MTNVILVVGSGGVGKTTMSAAIAADAVRAGHRTLVLTVDPARRLAQALGVTLGNVPAAVPGLWGLDAAMIDASRSWEGIIRASADPATAERLLANRFFRAVADRFPSGQAYAAADEMTRHADSGHWDLVVVDTPPSGGGIDVLASPRRIRALVAGRALRWLTGPAIPARRAIYSVTARPALRLADTVLGGPLLEDVAEFLIDLRVTYDGIGKRSRRVEARFSSAAIVLVYTFLGGLTSAIYNEILQFPETPPQVAIDEAVELAKQYGPETSSGFVNAILDRLLREQTLA